MSAIRFLCRWQRSRGLGGGHLYERTFLIFMMHTKQAFNQSMRLSHRPTTCIRQTD